MNYYQKYLKYKQKYLKKKGGTNNENDMKVSNSDKVIKTSINNIYISQVQYKSCGMTVVSSPNYLDYYIDKRGKNVYGMGTDMLYGSEEASTYAKAICLVGGSTLGLEGICGVNQALIEDTKNNPENENVPAIGATCYSYNIQSKDYTHPDIKLGKFAYENKGLDLLIGKVGAGVNTRLGKLYSDYKENMFYAGQGAAYFEKNKMKCFCIVVLNSLGVVHNEKGELLHPFKTGKIDISKIQDMPQDNWLIKTAVNSDLADALNKKPTPKKKEKKLGNTTLTIFVTNIIYNKEKMKFLSKELHNVVESMIYPYGTILDGDIFFLVSSKELETDIDYLEDYKSVVKNAIKSPFIKKKQEKQEKQE